MRLKLRNLKNRLITTAPEKYSAALPTSAAKKEGKMTDFYPDGKIKGERLFKNDKQIGKTTLFFPSGQVKEVQYYVDGFKEGGDTLWYENRQPQFVMDYKAGKRHGYLRKWSPEGELIYEARFEMDSLVEVKGEKVK